MKNFIKRNHLALSAVAVCVILLVFLYCIGFRITYAPQLENGWDAISAVATWASVVVSCFAVWAAIQIPQRIAEEQNDVSEKQARMNIFLEFYNSQNFKNMISYMEKKLESIEAQKISS